MSLEPLRYTLRFPSPQTHYVEVEADLPTDGRASIEVFMAVWTPGSYLIREYQRHVEHVRAVGPAGRELQVVKSRKNRWRIETSGANRVTVLYRVYGREMTVRSNWIEADFAMINGAPTFLTLVDAPSRPHEVTVDLPAAWTTVSTALLPLEGRPGTFVAANFDVLVDSPLVLGNSVARQFLVADRRHYMVFEGDVAFIDVDRAAADAKRIVEAAGEIMGRHDYPHYFFLTLVTDAGGGLEHRDSTLLMTNRYVTRSDATYLKWNGLVAHEFFHNWNVKRLRPVELGPFDYEREVHTRSLWVAEGFTVYYEVNILRRSGIASVAAFLEQLSAPIRIIETAPGNLVTPVGQASYDAWLKQYRPDENTQNTTISYYSKGAAIALLLDARIRRESRDTASLDDVMRLAYARYSGTRGYTPAEFMATASEVASADLSTWLEQLVETTQPFDYSHALDWFGLRFKPVEPSQEGWLGIETRHDDGRLLVDRVPRGTPAFDAGVNVDDEIVAIDGVRIRADGLETRMQQYAAGDRIELLVGRRDRLTPLTVTLAADPGDAWLLEPDPDASEEQRLRFERYARVQLGVDAD